MSRLEVDTTELKAYAEKLKTAAKADFKNEASLWLEAIGVEFLRIVEDEIRRLEAVDTRLLVKSFTKGDENNIWIISDGGLTLTLGTHVEYAVYVNYGHNTIDLTKNKHFYLPNGEAARFVPGEWNGDRFEYKPGSKTGMVLKMHWVEKKPFWNNAKTIFEYMFPKLVSAKFEQWLRKYF